MNRCASSSQRASPPRGEHGSQAYAVEVSPTTLPDPRLDAGDTVTLAIRGVPTGPRILAGFEVPLDPNSQRMPVTLRSPLSGVAVSIDLQEE